jgi:hypothetical protein
MIYLRFWAGALVFILRVHIGLRLCRYCNIGTKLLMIVDSRRLLLKWRVSSFFDFLACVLRFYNISYSDICLIVHHKQRRRAWPFAADEERDWVFLLVAKTHHIVADALPLHRILTFCREGGVLTGSLPTTPRLGLFRSGCSVFLYKLALAGDSRRSDELRVDHTRWGSEGCNLHVVHIVVSIAWLGSGVPPHQRGLRGFLWLEHWYLPSRRWRLGLLNHGSIQSLSGRVLHLRFLVKFSLHHRWVVIATDCHNHCCFHDIQL